MQTSSKHKTGRWIETTYSLDPPLPPPQPQQPLPNPLSKQSINAHHPHRLLSLGKTISAPLYDQWLFRKPCNHLLLHPPTALKLLQLFSTFHNNLIPPPPQSLHDQKEGLLLVIMAVHPQATHFHPTNWPHKCLKEQYGVLH